MPVFSFYIKLIYVYSIYKIGKVYSILLSQNEQKLDLFFKMI